ncbi:MAG: 50S ribosomal protein L24 [Acholeplasmataceae bacterium]|jgi:large subunit ribosomal protein L24
MYIKTGDLVAVIAGKDQFTKDKKGNKVRTTGRVLKVYPKTNRVIVQGVNMVTKHQAPSHQNEKGQIVEKEAPIHVSNVALIDPKTKTPTRIGIREVDGKKIRYAKKSGENIDK